MSRPMHRPNPGTRRRGAASDPTVTTAATDPAGQVATDPADAADDDDAPTRPLSRRDRTRTVLIAGAVYAAVALLMAYQMYC
ncbi:MAG: hypothetical protein H6708_32815 [Kofleriaceae bacterium]|nr:hypothetical protein [Kofleriaceae bacterium]